LAPWARFEAVNQAGRSAATAAGAASAADSVVAEQQAVSRSAAEERMAGTEESALKAVVEPEQWEPKARLAAVDSAGPLAAAVAAEERFVPA
jgi:hypothetical protein